MAAQPISRLDHHRKLTTSLQHDQAARIALLQATCTGSVRTSLRRVASTPANFQLTFQLDHSVRADQS